MALSAAAVESGAMMRSHVLREGVEEIAWSVATAHMLLRVALHRSLSPAALECEIQSWSMLKRIQR